ncbi:MAG TPA: hypothetical protein P5298_12120 [Spirochaetia bacterium]|nr:hypothetical protein [Spirochaetaceae bacterium]HPE89815.1 hypothetical protein [Spirochaetales bacterium]HRW25149.1 hypothetical protein [Spirochaetia bacterium]
MPKITQEQRNRYAAKVKEYKAMTDGILAKEQSLLNVLKQPNAQGQGYVRVSLSEQMLVLTSYQILINSLSVSLLGIKNEDSLSEARKSVGRAIKYLEDIVTGYVDAPFSEYEQSLEAIAEISYEKRYALLRKIGFAIGEIEEGYGANSKWKWSFVELWGKLAVVAKNSLDLKKAFLDMDLASPNRMIALSYLAFIKKQLQATADRYREKYEVSSMKMDDFKQAILFLNALKRIHVVFGERTEAEELKRKIEIWSAKLESDQKKREEEAKKR